MRLPIRTSKAWRWEMRTEKVTHGRLTGAAALS